MFKKTIVLIATLFSFNHIKALRNIKRDYTKIVKTFTPSVEQYEKINITLLNHILRKEEIDDKIIVEQLLLLHKITEQEIPQFLKNIKKLHISLEKRIKGSQNEYEINHSTQQINYLYNQN